MGQALLNAAASRSYTDSPHSVGLLWTSDQPDADTSTWQYTTRTKERHPCPPVVLEPIIPVSEQRQSHALDRAATGIGEWIYTSATYIILDWQGLITVPFRWGWECDVLQQAALQWWWILSFSSSEGEFCGLYILIDATENYLPQIFLPSALFFFQKQSGWWEVMIC